MPTISILIPSKNRYQYVLDLLSDLSLQVKQPAEIIIIDQSDEPYQDLPCIHIHDDGLGPCRARNKGLETSHGDIIVFLDDDIRISPDFLELICAPIIEQKVHVVVGAMCNAIGEYPYRENVIWKKNKSNWLLSLTDNPDFPGQCPTLSFTTCCAAISREVYQKIGGFDPFFDPNGAGEDREYGLRVLHAGYPILFEGKAFVKHLGAATGGRRENPTGYRYQNILEANSVYIVAKYFNWQVFNNYCSEWLTSILKRGLTIHPRICLWHFKRWNESRRIVEKIREIKKINQW